MMTRRGGDDGVGWALGTGSSGTRCTEASLDDNDDGVEGMSSASRSCEGEQYTVVPLGELKDSAMRASRIFRF